MKRKPPYKQPQFNFDPDRRLLAAITLRAIEDYLNPPSRLSQLDRQTAAEFCNTQTDIFLDLGIPIEKIKRTIGNGTYQKSLWGAS